MHRNINWLSHHYQLRENGLNICSGNFSQQSHTFRNEKRSHNHQTLRGNEKTPLNKTLKCP